MVRVKICNISDTAVNCFFTYIFLNHRNTPITSGTTSSGSSPTLPSRSCPQTAATAEQQQLPPPRPLFSTSTPEAVTAVEGEEGRGRRYLHSLRPSSPLLAAEAEGQAASTKNPSSHRHQVRVLINTDLKIRKFVYITGSGYFRFTFYFFCGNFVGFMFFPAPRDCKIETKKVSY